MTDTERAKSAISPQRLYEIELSAKVGEAFGKKGPTPDELLELVRAYRFLDVVADILKTLGGKR